MKRFVVLDRDGTIIVGRPYLAEPDDVELIPGAALGLLALARLGLGLCIATNQSGIGRGFFDRSRVDQIHERLRILLAVEGVYLDGIFICPHVPEARCRCRKPETGMLEQAAREIGLDPSRIFVVGDNRDDMELGRRVGATTLLVKTGYGKQVAADPMLRPDYIVEDIGAASATIQRIVAGQF